jgi:hypothetical protein
VEYRDYTTSHLREDTRILASVLSTRRVFQSPMYEVYLCVYSGLIDSKRLHEDLATCLVAFKEEGVRIMFKLWTDEIRGNRHSYLEGVVRRLEKEGRGPLHLVRDAKVWSGTKFTLRDLAAMKLAGIDVPLENQRAAGSWRSPGQ